MNTILKDGAALKALCTAGLDAGTLEGLALYLQWVQLTRHRSCCQWHKLLTLIVRNSQPIFIVLSLAWRSITTEWLLA